MNEQTKTAYVHPFAQISTDGSIEAIHSGMTLRDHFAGLAMQGVIVNCNLEDEPLAKASYKMADAMLKAREEQS